MQIKSRHIPIAVAVLTLVAGIRIGATATQEDEAIDRGKKDFVEVGCYQCHGYQGQGGAGPRIAPKPLSLEAFTRWVRHTLEATRNSQVRKALRNSNPERDL